MKPTQEQIILKVLEDVGDFVPSYNLIKVNTKWGWLGSGADRVARSLAEEGKITRERKGKYTYYRVIHKHTLF